MFRTTTIFVISLLVALTPIAPVFATDNNAVRTANYFLLSGTTLDDAATLETLSQYDLLVLPAEAQVYNRNFPAKIRAKNPDIILLAYVPSVSWNNIWRDDLHEDLYSGIKSSYWLKDSNGNNVSIWPNTQALDLTSGWNDYLADFVADNVLDDDYWDGVFYDEVSDEISWVGSVSLSNANGGTDAAWADAYTDLFAKTRQRVGSNKIIITNGSSNLQHAPYVNGRMFESFPTPWEGDGSWHTVMNNYFALEDRVAYEPIIVLNSDTGNTGNQGDYRAVRFGIASTLLGGGFFGFDYGTTSHQQLWRYDEYDAFLGEAKGEPTANDQGVWSREYTNGKVLVNPTDGRHSVSLGGDFEKLHGIQDPIVNDGSIVSRVSINPWDGLLLLRPLEEIVGGVFFNGAFTRVFNANGDAFRTGFFAYDEDHFGGMQVISYDIDLDGNLETIAADGNQVFIYNEDGSLHASAYPYTQAYQSGVNIAVGDIENDGSVEIVTGTEAGGGAHVRVLNKDAVVINPGFFAYDDVYRGGVNVAIGDFNGDGTKEIATGAGLNGGPHVRIFNKNGQLINPGFFAFDPSYRSGVNVAAGDVDGDGIDEIITGQGAGGAPEVRVYDNDGNLESTPFYAFNVTDRDGVEVSTADLDGDGIDEILALTRDVFTLSGLFE